MLQSGPSDEMDGAKEVSFGTPSNPQAIMFVRSISFAAGIVGQGTNVDEGATVGKGAIVDKGDVVGGLLLGTADGVN